MSDENNTLFYNSLPILFATEGRKEQILALRDERERCLQEVSSLQEEKRECLEEARSLRDERKKSSEEISGLKEEKRECLEEVRSLKDIRKSSNIQSEERIEALRQRIQKERFEKERCLAEIDVEKKKIQDLVKEKQEKIEEIETKAVEQYQPIIDRLTFDLTSAKDQLETMQNTLKECQSRINLQSTQLKQFHDRNQTYKSLADQYKAQNEKYLLLLEKLQKQNKEYKDVIDSFESTGEAKEGYITRIQQLESENTKQQTKISQLGSENIEQQRKLSQAETDESEYQKIIFHLESQVEDYKNKMNHLQIAIQESKTEDVKVRREREGREEREDMAAEKQEFSMKEISSIFAELKMEYMHPTQPYIILLWRGISLEGCSIESISLISSKDTSLNLTYDHYYPIQLICHHFDNAENPILITNIHPVLEHNSITSTLKADIKNGSRSEYQLESSIFKIFRFP